MDIHILRPDKFIVREIVDIYESFIWTERYDVRGDFELVMTRTPGIREKFKPGTFMSHSDTNRGGVIERAYDSTDDEGYSTFTVKGYTLETILNQRIVLPWMDWQYNWRSQEEITPVETALKLAFHVLIDGANTGYDLDRMPDDMFIAAYTPDPNAVKEELVIEVQPLNEAITALCKMENAGYRMIMRPNQAPRMYLEFYRGQDRPNVIFSSALDTLVNVSRLDSIENYITNSWVFTNDNFYRAQYSPGPWAIGKRGFDRRVTFLDATDIQLESLEYKNNPDNPQHITDAYFIMKARAQEQLTRHQRELLLDGEVPFNTKSKFRASYDLGDIVRLGERTDELVPMRVAEYIWVSDKEGHRSFPTFRIPETE